MVIFQTNAGGNVRIPIPLLLLLLIVCGLLFNLLTAHGQDVRSPAQVAKDCDTKHGSVLATNVKDRQAVHLPHGFAMKSYELAFEDGGVPNSLCIQTRPFKKGESAEVHKLLFGDGSHLFDIVEHDLQKKVFRSAE